MSLKIKTTPEIAAKLKDAKTFEARLFQPPHSQADKREMQKLLSDIQNGNRAIIIIDLGRQNQSARLTVVLEGFTDGCE